MPILIFLIGAIMAKNVSGSKNLTEIKWAHAVNSQDLLTTALDSNIDMIEADIILGVLINEPNNEKKPVMGHPPNTESDISLEDFLKRILKYNKENSSKTKGVKLDFKSTEVFSGSLEILQKMWALMTYPVWINADIIPGPVDNVATVPVSPSVFFSGCKHFENAVLSVGWTTRWGEEFREGQYTNSQIDRMLEAIQENGINESGHDLTFPVRAGIVASSRATIEHLLNKFNTTNNATLTIWSSPKDYVDIEMLRSFIYDFGVDKIYLDVPEEVADKLHLKSRNGALNNLLHSLKNSTMKRMNCYGLLGLLSFTFTIYLLRKN